MVVAALGEFLRLADCFLGQRGLFHLQGEQASENSGIAEVGASELEAPLMEESCARPPLAGAAHFLAVAEQIGWNGIFKTGRASFRSFRFG